jgi:membrane protease YdiL (CAAX protease family)
MDERQINELWWNAIAYGLIAGAAVLGIIGVYLFVPAVRRRWLPMVRLRPGAWTGREVFLVFCAYIGFPSVIVMMLMMIGFFNPLIGPAPDPESAEPAFTTYAEQCGAISSPLFLTVTLGVIFAMLFARRGVRPHHLGLSRARLPANLALGLAALLIGFPLVMGVHVAVGLLLGNRPHALTQAGQQIREQWEWFFLAFQATVAAPVLEEIVFRGVLLGWLRRATLAGHMMVIAATLLVSTRGISYEDPVAKEAVTDFGPLIFAAVLAGIYIILLIRVARQFGLAQEEIATWEVNSELATDRADAFRAANAKLAVFGSAMLFASFHAPGWPDPLPLLLLGLILGWLAMRTQSLIGPITLHAVFNLVAFIALFGTAHHDFTKNGSEVTTAVRPSLVGSITTSVPASQLPLRK